MFFTIFKFNSEAWYNGQKPRNWNYKKETKKLWKVNRGLKKHQMKLPYVVCQKIVNKDRSSLVGSHWFSPLQPNICSHTVARDLFSVLNICSKQPSLSLSWTHCPPKGSFSIFFLKAVFLKLWNKIALKQRKKMEVKITESSVHGKSKNCLVKLYSVICVHVYCDVM